VLAAERVVRLRPGDKDGHGESYEPALATGNAAAVATQTAKKGSDTEENGVQDG